MRATFVHGEHAQLLLRWERTETSFVFCESRGEILCALPFGFCALSFGLGAVSFGLGAVSFGLGAVSFGLGAVVLDFCKL
jgi:hypothetical protein